MNALVACVVCARPFDSLLTSGLQAGVVALVVVVVVVIGALGRGALGLWREDEAHVRAEAGANVATDGGQR